MYMVYLHVDVEKEKKIKKICSIDDSYLFSFIFIVVVVVYSPSRSLCSASDTRIFHVPRVCRRTHGERSFQYIGPVIWNSLSFSVRHATSLSSFKSKLKPTSSFLPTDLSLSFFCFDQNHDYYACVFAEGVCVCVCVRVCVCGVCTF